jgi:hypothetical protein
MLSYLTTNVKKIPTVQDVEKDDLDKEVEKECRSKQGQEFMADLQRLSDGVARDPRFLDRRVGDLGGEQEKEPAAN